MKTLDDALLQRLGPAGGERVIWLVGPGLPGPLQAAQGLLSGRLESRTNVAGLADLEGLAAADCAVLQVAPAALLTPGITHVLARLRDQLARRVLVDPRPADIDERIRTGLRSLGYQPVTGCPALHEYDIGHYNPEREWNNAEDWAHPENFSRYRW
ncbi:MAG: hypothetical protein JJT85_08450 [Chromatiales bacterium]|nr:hypothetical protein [Chromatiales bacterium]